MTLVLCIIQEAKELIIKKIYYNTQQKATWGLNFFLQFSTPLKPTILNFDYPKKCH